MSIQADVNELSLQSFFSEFILGYRLYPCADLCDGNIKISEASQRD